MREDLANCLEQWDATTEKLARKWSVHEKVDAMADLLPDERAIVIEPVIDPDAMAWGALALTDRQLLFNSRGGQSRIPLASVDRFQFHPQKVGYFRFGAVLELRVASAESLFELQTQESAERLRTELETQVARTKAEGETTAGSTAPADRLSSSVADEIAKFAQLRDNGALTQEEFEAQKRQLLGM